ncbi:four helix bundle protein [Flavobacterium sp.]
MNTYRNLIVWQKAMNLVTTTYEITLEFPKTEQYCLTDQMRRSALSIPCNIAEGKARNSNKDFIRFLRIALGSLFEFQTQLEIAKNIEYINQEQFQRLWNFSTEIEVILVSFIKKINV